MLMLRHSDKQENEVRPLIKEIHRYAAIDKIDVTTLNRIINKILVCEFRKINRWQKSVKG